MKRRSSLFLKSFFQQLLWFIPLTACGYYCYTHLPNWCDTYFGVLDMKTPPSPTPLPTSLFDSFRTFMVETTTSAKLYMLSSISLLVARLGQLILDVLGIIFLWKFITKLRLSYQAKSRDSDLVQAVISELKPEITALRQEVAYLSAQLKQKGNKK